MKHYTDAVLELFNNIQHMYIHNYEYNIVGTAGDLKIGEYIILYLNVDINKYDISISNIIEAKFSAMGSPMLLASAEYLCSMIKNNTIEQVNNYCNPNNINNIYKLDVIDNKQHTINFVVQALYNAMAKISNYGCETS